MKSMFYRTPLAVLALTLLLCGSLRAQADTWEPNNNVGQAQLLTGHVAGTGLIAGLEFFLGGTRALFENLTLTSGDEDWFRLRPAPLSGDLVVFLNQLGATSAGSKLAVEIRDTAGATVISGPGVGTYQLLDSFGTPPDPYDGVRVRIAATIATEYIIRVYNPAGSPPIPAGPGVAYQLSVEWGTPDSSDSTYSNNFPGTRPRPGPGQEANVTPAGFGPGNALSLGNRQWGGYDYYAVTLNSPGRIQFEIDGFTNLPSPTMNFDLYWIWEIDGSLLEVPTGTGALQGAEDTFPNGWAAGMAAQVANPRASESITTPPLAPGTYYFHVMAWDLGTVGAVVPGEVAGNYNLRVTLTSSADDAFEGSPENDTAANATTIQSGTTSNLRLLNDFTGAEQDWYKIQVNDGENLQVQMIIAAPFTDDLDLLLYRPNATAPGSPADLADASSVDNTDTQNKGTPTATEMVGTWGTVGPSGNTNMPAGEYLIQVVQGGLLINTGYDLVITKAGPVNIAPDDNKEQNDSFIQVSPPVAPGPPIQPQPAFTLAGGLYNGLRAMDGADWYRFQVNANAQVGVTLFYDAGVEADLDIELIDMNGGPLLTSQGLLTLAASNYARETTVNSVVLLTATAGQTFVAAGQTVPPVGLMYVRVTRAASKGLLYSLNININGNTPPPPLRMNQVLVSPNTVVAPNATTVTVSVQNQSGQPQSLQNLFLRLVHSGGSDVTSQYNISPATPALPDNINAGLTKAYQFSVTSTAASTNGVISVIVEGSDSSGGPLLGNPRISFTLTGGAPPTPELVYDQITVGGTLAPAGVAAVRVRLRNIGTLGGNFEDNGLVFSYIQGGVDISGNFNRLTQPLSPVFVPSQGTAEFTITFSITQATPIGTTSLSISGGGGLNPQQPGSTSFEIRDTFGDSRKASGGGGCAIGAGGLGMLPLLGVGLAGIAARRRRRR